MATEQFLTEKTPWRSFSTDKQYVSKKRPLNLHAFFPSTGQICDITLVKCVRKLLSLSCAYLCIIYIKRQKANFLSRKRLLHSENLVQPLFSVKTFYDNPPTPPPPPPPPPRPLKFLCRPCGIHNKCSLSVFKEDTN